MLNPNDVALVVASVVIKRFLVKEACGGLRDVVARGGFFFLFSAPRAK